MGWILLPLPDPLFSDPTCTVLLDSHQRMLGAALAADGQWRFQGTDALPENYVNALLCFEDRRFFSHSGVDLRAVLRATWQNLRARRVKSGASTITMQVIRLSRKNQPRSLLEKAKEAVLALKLERRMEKQEILRLYASHAPFGGNMVGLEAATWRYFNRPPAQLSWAEAALLAVLPNNPALMHPGRKRHALRRKRDGLLDVLAERGVIDGVTRDLAQREALPSKPDPWPSQAPHLLADAHQDSHPQKGRTLQTTLDRQTQNRATAILMRYVNFLEKNGVYNAAALILENQGARVRAYVGNSGPVYSHQHGQAVDMVKAERSSGSTLKPMLHAAMLDTGLLLPQALLADIPTHIGGYSPQNFSGEYDGAVPADQALARSLNVPAVRNLRRFGAARFLSLLRNMGFSTLDQDASHYGLSLILGGSEIRLWDLAAAYSAMCRVVTRYHESGGYYHQGEFHEPRWILESDEALPTLTRRPPRLGAASIWHTLTALTLADRPEAEGIWQMFQSAQRIAWKTGTSFGFRDAWAVGCTPDFTVAVWVGNADGEGRPGLTGASVAAPLLFELFGILPRSSNWFAMPKGDTREITCCAHSGFRAGPHCDQTRIVLAPAAAGHAPQCPYCKTLHLDPDGHWQVNHHCCSPSEMQHVSRFVLSPGMEWFYKPKHPEYRVPPPVHPECEQDALTLTRGMEIIYPKTFASLFVPKELDGSQGNAVFEVAHRNPDAEIHWHLDRDYLGTTRTFHQMPLNPEPGSHTLVLVDDQGETLTRTFAVLDR